LCHIYKLFYFLGNTP